MSSSGVRESEGNVEKKGNGRASLEKQRGLNNPFKLFHHKKIFKNLKGFRLLNIIMYPNRLLNHLGKLKDKN